MNQVDVHVQASYALIGHGNIERGENVLNPEYVVEPYMGVQCEFKSSTRVDRAKN